VRIIRPRRLANKLPVFPLQKLASNPVERAARLLYGIRSKFGREPSAAPDAGENDSSK
jgi:hypothetical protein